MNNNSSVKIDVGLKKSTEDYSVDKNNDNLCEWDGVVEEMEEFPLPHNNYWKEQKKRIHPTEVEVEIRSSKRLRKSKKKRAVIVIADEDEDISSQPVTVEVETSSEFPGQDGVILSKRVVQVNFLSHCIFCLRKTTKSSIEKHHLHPTAKLTDNSSSSGFSSSSQLLSTFNCTWRYLQMKNKSEVEGDDPVGFLEYITGRAKNENDVTTFLHFPSMCNLCAGKLEAIDKLFRDLQTQLEVIGMIIQASKCSGKTLRRSEQFKSSLMTSNLEKQVVAATIDLLDKLDGYSRKDCQDGTNGDPLSTTALTPNSAGSLTMEGQNDSSSLSSVIPELENTGLQENTVLPNDLKETKNELNPSNVHLHEEPLTTYSDDDESIPNNFVDEDDWSDNNDVHQDSDYIKSEPDDDHFSEDGTSSDSNDSFAIRKTRTSRRKHAKSSSLSITPDVKSTTHKQKVGQVGATGNNADGQMEELNVLNEDNQCNICSKSFSNSCHLKTHKRRSHGVYAKCRPARRKKPKSSSSSTTLGGKKNVSRKETESSGSNKTDEQIVERDHQCNVFRKLFSTTRNLARHRRQVHGTYVKTIPFCDLCKAQVPSKDFLEHVRAHIGDEYLIKCPNLKCRRVFTSPSSLKIHLRERHIGRNLCCKSVSNVNEFLDAFKTCQLCNHKAKSIIGLRTHLLREHENAAKTFNCPIDGCAKQFSIRQSVALHIATHDRIDGKVKVQNSCDLCNAKVSSDDILEHVRAHVGDEYIIKCPNLKCSRVFSQLYSLKCHLRESTGGCHKSLPNVQEYLDTFNICQVCGYKAEDTNILRHHLLREHEKENATKSFTCPINGCSKKFSDRQSVALHIAAHGKLQKSCDLCKAKVSPDDILEHVRAHVGDEYIIKCPNSKCSSVFSQVLYLKGHLRENTGGCRESLSNVQEFLDTFNICQICGYKAGDIIILRRHLLREHENETKSFPCPIDACSKTFSSRQSVALHISHHDISKKIQRQTCNECGMRIKPSKMADHYREIHSLREIIKCTRCTAVFASWESLVHHMFSHRHGVLSCDICGDKERFSNHGKLREHYFHKHQVGTRYTCEQCGYVALSSMQLARHKRRLRHGKTRDIGNDSDNASGNGSKEKMNVTLQCNICLISFIHRTSLQDHNIKKHGGELYSCKLCGQTFLTHALHRKHKMAHNGGSFMCDVEGCGKKFKQNKGLKHHIASVHLGLKPHICEVCGKAFTAAQGLREHRDSVHLRLKPFVCEECGESFSNTSVLSRHKLIHSGERPFACKICGQTFRQNAVLGRHLNAHRRKGADFKPKGPMKQIRKRVERKN